jgi:formylglycine-generating enzyme required for sulfatase activity
MKKNPSKFKVPNRPVEKVTWEEAGEYCRRAGKRLPTSIEWEKAARAGAGSKYPWGNELGKNNANCNDCGSQWDGLETAPVGSFSANALGLYDMVGNVWEWVDKTHDNKFKVLRGGSWMDDSSFANPEGSYFILPDNRSSDIGFRCAITQRQSIAPMKTVSDNNSLQEETVQLAEATVLTPLETVSDSNSLQNKKEQLAEETLRSVNNVEIASLPPNEIETPTANWSGEDEMVLIPGGRFVSGEFFSRKFKVVKAFKMDTHEITQKEYERVMMKNPSRFRGERNPVEKISWYEAKEYCERLGKRLPKGDEWEKAARAGTSSNYPWGNNLGENKANCPDCGSEWDALKTAPVGSFPANAWGLYDMAGNVWEWVDETHNEKFKVLRGGSWMDDSSYINPAASYFVLPDNRSSDIGFRCAKDADSAK